MKKIYVVSTPIGNLEDITIRALNILKSADVILCENPKHHIKLLNHYGIKGKKLIKINSSNEENSINGIIKLLDKGKSIALVSDAGTPNVSDPGGFIVREMYKRGVKCIPIPGPSSLTASLSVSPIPVSKFVFYGFLPKGRMKIRNILQNFKNLELPIVFLVSSTNINDFIKILCEEYPNSQISIFKELTKVNEEIIYSAPCNISLDTRGEFVVILKI
ncbi:MAG: 16S rRNA (cytidine(1402)-2'-O)-methyltransferase [Brevinematales bacterium]|nr:16S rRNA (cytidine(1402)-2'-O)-methyltransferase [Brevinematales bacterium]